MSANLEDVKALIVWARDNGLRALKVETDDMVIDAVFAENAQHGPVDVGPVPHAVYPGDWEGEENLTPDRIAEKELYGAVD